MTMSLRQAVLPHLLSVEGDAPRAGAAAPCARTEAIGFLLELGQALHRFGTPAHRLEGALSGVAESLGMGRPHIFSSPTMLLVACDEPGTDTQRTVMLRLDPGELDLGKLAEVDRVADAVVDGSLSLVEGRRRIDAIVAAPSRYGRLLPWLAWGLVSAGVAVFFQGGAEDVAAAGLIGLVVGALAQAMTSKPAGARIFELVAAFVATVGAGMAARLAPPVSSQVTLLAGLIVLVPGLALTTAMAELATRNLVSGNARLTAALIVFLEMAFGVALGERLVVHLLGPLPATVAPGLPTWAEPMALVLTALGLVVLFHVEAKTFGWIVLACFGAFYGARLGAWILGPELGASLGAFAVAAGGNLYARSGQGPAQVPIVPGILLLVPGSLGLRSLSSLLADDVVTGVDTAFTVVLVAVSIVAGLLFAHATVPPRRQL